MMKNLKRGIIWACYMIACSCVCQGSTNQPLATEEPQNLEKVMHTVTEEEVVGQPFLLKQGDGNSVVLVRIGGDKFISLARTPRRYKLNTAGDLVPGKKCANVKNWWGDLEDGTLEIFSREYLENTQFGYETDLTLWDVGYYMLSLFGPLNNISTVILPANVADLLLDSNMPNVNNIILTDCDELSESSKLNLNNALSRLNLRRLEVRISSSDILLNLQNALNYMNAIKYSQLSTGIRIKITYPQDFTETNALSQAFTESRISGELGDLPSNARLSLGTYRLESKNNVCCSSFIAGAIDGLVLSGVIAIFYFFT